MHNNFAKFLWKNWLWLTFLNPQFVKCFVHIASWLWATGIYSAICVSNFKQLYSNMQNAIISVVLLGVINLRRLCRV